MKMGLVRFFSLGYHRNHFEPKHSCTSTLLDYLWYKKDSDFFAFFIELLIFFWNVMGAWHLGALMYFPHGIPLFNQAHSWMAIKIHQLR
jgi:hypothetical protein